MFWADELAESIGSTPHHVDDMTTPSGYSHIGSLRGPVLHDVIYKVLRNKNPKTIQTYVFNDFDPIDGLPKDLEDSHKQYMGMPVRAVPAPYGKKGSFGEYFANDFRRVLEELGIEATFISSWDMYHEGKFNGVIREALDNADNIQNVYHEIAGSKKKAQGWLPFQVICPTCNKLGTTLVTGWDGTNVQYVCKKNLVTWAEGCGHEGYMSPFDGNGKLPWKVDWPAHWKVMGVTFEGAGKDHASRGGSYDIAFALCEKVFHYPKPYYFPYEFFLFGGKKMSSSKGLGFKARDLTTVLPPSVARFLIVRTKPKTTLEFSPDGMTIPDLFDEFDRCAELYWTDQTSDLGRVFAISQVSDRYREHIFLPRFRDVANVIQMHTLDPMKHFETEKGSPFSDSEKQILEERVTYARYWIEHHAPDHARFMVTKEMPSQVNNLSQKQKDYLRNVAEMLDHDLSPDDVQTLLYEEGKKLQLSGKDTFVALYTALLGKDHGPRAAWLISSLKPEFVKRRFIEASDLREAESSKKQTTAVGSYTNASIDKEVNKTLKGMSFAYVVIKNVRIQRESKDLEEYKQEVLKKFAGLTTDDISNFSTIAAYRKLFKSFGVDWHSRRPSPDALLRRIALGKGLYKVNTLVDSYNMAVIQTQIGLGAFDMSKLHLPIVLRFAQEGERVHLLGDDEEISLREGELVYADKERIITVDLNYRDANHTKVTEKTKDIILFADGAPGIPRGTVMEGLEKGIELIVKFCGGIVSEKSYVS